MKNKNELEQSCKFAVEKIWYAHRIWKWKIGVNKKENIWSSVVNAFGSKKGIRFGHFSRKEMVSYQTWFQTCVQQTRLICNQRRAESTETMVSDTHFLQMQLFPVWCQLGDNLSKGKPPRKWWHPAWIEWFSSVMVGKYSVCLLAHVSSQKPSRICNGLAFCVVSMSLQHRSQIPG